MEVPLVERNVVRLVLLDDKDRILLLHVRDVSNPAFGTAWELPGGGIESGETYADAAIRELREETGIEITREVIAPPTWRRDVAYTYHGVRRLQHECVAAVRLQSAAAVPIRPTRGIDFEHDDLFEQRWWRVSDIMRGRERFYPRSLPTLLPRFLAGVTIEEPFETWP